MPQQKGQRKKQYGHRRQTGHASGETLPHRLKDLSLLTSCRMQSSALPTRTSCHHILRVSSKFKSQPLPLLACILRSYHAIEKYVTLGGAAGQATQVEEGTLRQQDGCPLGHGLDRTWLKKVGASHPQEVPPKWVTGGDTRRGHSWRGQGNPE